jgi:uncharacterized protein YjbI with pentapeptide repeats
MPTTKIKATSIADNAVTSAAIADDAITTALIADNAIGSAAVSNNAITTAKLADANVTTAKLADANVTTAKLANTSVTSAKLSGALTTPSSLTLGGDLIINTNNISGGDYSSLQPEQVTASVSSTHNIDMNKPLHIITLSASTTFSFTNLAEGKITMIKMNAASGRTPSFGSNTKWPAATEPTWADHVYWLVSVIGHSGTITLASATGFTV